MLDVMRSDLFPALRRGFAALIVLFSLTGTLAAGPRGEQWEQVMAAGRRGLPKTALERLEPIIAGALADRSYAEATRAIAWKAKLADNRAESAIARLEAEIAPAPAVMKPMLEAILAHWYWGYFQQNRWRFQQRTRTAEIPGTDLLTWDLPRLLGEIDRHFTTALADTALLQRTPVAELNGLIDPGTLPDTYRPTLFDFLVRDALQFYQAGEQGAVHPEDVFILDADSPIFADLAAFAPWQPRTTDTSSPLLKAVLLYQQLLRFHAADADRTALLDADLDRLVFGSNVAVGENKTERYHAALQRFIEANPGHELSARARSLLATQLKDDPSRAHALVARGAREFPGSAGGDLCFNLQQQLEAPSAEMETELVWNAPWPTLNLTYRNLAKIHFRAVPLSFEEHARRARGNLATIGRDEGDLLLNSPAVREWSADLPATDDFKSRTEGLPVPTTLPPGFYAIIASATPDFTDHENQLSAVPVWVSNLALITITSSAALGSTGLVLHAGSGEPVAGARVRVWAQNTYFWNELAPVTTDQDGRFEVRSPGTQFILLAEAGGQMIGTREMLYASRPEPAPADQTRTLFFTDRAIYRPGQSVHYKGIAFNADPAARGVLAHRTVVVTLNDTNGKEIARATHVTNDYGSLTGVFTTPRDGISAEMWLGVEEGNGPEGEIVFSVEEYKRPKFQVELAAPADGAKLDEFVTVGGTATAFTGAAVGHAEVKWRVERGVSLPPWCFWWQPSGGVTAMAHGTAVTAADGTFAIQFTATADRTVPARLEPVFSYIVHADVTDTNGETRSVQRLVSAGYTAMQATVKADTWQTAGQPVNFRITTASLDDAPLAAAGTLTIRALQQPAQVARAPLQAVRRWSRIQAEPPVDPANPDSWVAGAVVATRAFHTDTTGEASAALTLQPGIYRAELALQDRFGRAVTARQTVEVIDPRARKYGVKLPNRFVAERTSVEPGEKFTAVWGTGYDAGRAFVEWECDGQPLQRYWTAAGRTQERIVLPVTESLRGGFTLRITFVHENRAYTEAHRIDVPWTNQRFSVAWERFRSKLQPGQPETWTATIRDRDFRKRRAEMVATLYDASLDEFRRPNWPWQFNIFREEEDGGETVFHNASVSLQSFHYFPRPAMRTFNWRHRSYPANLVNVGSRDFGAAPNPLNFYSSTVVTDERGELLVLSPFVIESGESEGYAAATTLAGTRIRTVLRDSASAISQGRSRQDDEEADEQALAKALDRVTTRKNLQETAFFLPQVVTQRKGVVKLQFTMPETLTMWRFLGFAHDKALRAGLLEGNAFTAKDLMVEPNPPRFVREGDAIEFTVKVSNQTNRPQTGRVRLTFADAATLASVDAALGNREPEQSFVLPAKQSRSFSWRVTVPDGMGFLTYRAVGATDKLSDGEEGYLPVLSRRILVTESLPLSIRGESTREFDFTKLRTSGHSTTLRHESLTVQMVSQPAWYAVMALPYLMEFPHECSEQLFNRYYANALARHIAISDPKIRQIFDLWKNTPALDSPLTKNQDLKAVMLEETPWLRQANRESEARRNVGLLFDDNRLDDETTRVLQQLAERQKEDGLWAWFPGGSSNEYISLYIMTGFGRLRHLGAGLDPAPALKSLDGLDAGMLKSYREIQRGRHPELYTPSVLDALYLYGRSFFLKDRPIAKENQPAVNFFLGQARKFWTSVDSRQSQAHLALALQRFGDQSTAEAIVKSFKERSISSEELGMSWREDGFSWWWYHAPIETQAMMIEAFAEITRDHQVVEDCQVWLLKQKQTQDWKTTKATADAIYALLIKGDNLLASDALGEVTFGDTAIKPEKVEAGTGFYEKKFPGPEIKPAMGHITVKKTDPGVSWGSVHWQYLEDMAKVTPHEGTPLTLKKSLWTKQTTARGPVLQPVAGPVAVGDELVVRLELRTDRDMEYLHLKDQRGSGTEPVSVISQYKYQDGLGYYESTRDTASHFYIDYLPKGTYVFEYATRVQLKGRYQSGIAEIQCMYAPEFNSHSANSVIEVK